MASAASGVATTTAGDTGCQVSPAPENSHQTAPSLLSQPAAPRRKVILVFLKQHGHRKKTGSNEIRMLTALSLGEETG